MALFTVTIGSYINLAPSVVGNKSINIAHNATYVFTLANFSTETIPQYSDPEGDIADTVEITTIPTTGVLNLIAVPVIALDIITTADFTANDLNYVADIGTETAYSENFTFDVSDVGSLTLAGLTGTLTINVAAKENLPPTVVGDGEMTIAYGETGIFTIAMFSTGTTPPYSDPESDLAENLKILTLPTLGTILLNGIPVGPNDVVPFSDIALGLLTYVPDLADTDGDMQGFTFEVADAGSGTFVG